MSDWNNKANEGFQAARGNGQMVCVYCGGYSSAVYCWPCSHLKQQVAEACAEKDKRIAELEEVLRQSIADRIVDLNSLMTTRSEQGQRLAEARRLIENFGTTGSDDMDVYRAAKKWLEGKP